jgi:hypothetical protein
MTSRFYVYFVEIKNVLIFDTRELQLMLFFHMLFCVIEQQSLVGILHRELDTIMNTPSCSAQVICLYKTGAL